MEMVGHYQLSQAVQRLENVLSQGDDAIQTGNLGASLTTFEVGDNYVTSGSNLVYAAQVQFGGIIEPVNARALAIPLDPRLQRQKLGPLDIDPNREALQFIPYTGSKPNVFGLLINPQEERDGGTKGRRDKGTLSGWPTGPLYALAYWVSQEPRPYLYIDDEDVAAIAGMWHTWMNGE